MTARASDILIVLPAFNEEASISDLLDELALHVPHVDVLVVSDGSDDRTAALALRKGATALDLPCNLGVGGAVQTGFRHAVDRGYRYVIRCDADGQHPPAEIPKLEAAIRKDDVDLVIGSRFLGETAYKSTKFRYCGIIGLSWLLALICRKRISDPTSGFQAMNRCLAFFFSRSYPMDYPEPEALALMRRQGYDFREIPVSFRERQAGQSSIRGWGTFYYVVKVSLALLVDRARSVDKRLSRSHVEAML